jgi:hypothetical protein
MTVKGKGSMAREDNENSWRVRSEKIGSFETVCLK